jgi:hypothetical protein
MDQAKTSYSVDHGDMEHEQADPRVVQQLMFNRVLSFLRTLGIDGVAVADISPGTGTLTCSLAGVTFAVNVSLKEPKPATDDSP